MASDPLTSSVARQFDRMWKSLADAIGHWPADAWQSGDVDFLIPVRLALHAIEAVDFYTQAGPKEFQRRTSGNWEFSPATELPPQAEMLDYLATVHTKTRRWLESLGSERLLAEQSEYVWTGPTALDRAVYALRHGQHHLGQINSELRRRNLPRGEWA